MNPLLEQFVIESRDFLDSIAQGLLTLERDPRDSAAIDELFRAVHTLKGNSGLFAEYSAFTHLVHAGEDLLDVVRDGTRGFDAEVADHLLECMDIVSLMLDNIDAGKALDPRLCEAGRELAVTLRALRAGPLSQSPIAADPEPALAPADPPETGEAPLPGATSGMHFRYIAERGCFFKGEDPLYNALQAPGLQRITVEPVQPWPALDLLDPYDCNLAIEGWCEASREALQEHFRYVIDQVEIDTVAANTGQPLATPATGTPARDAATLADRGLSEEDESAAARILRSQYEVLARARGEGSEGIWRSVAMVLRGLANAHGTGHEAIDEALQLSLKTASGDPLARVLNQMAEGTQAPRDLVDPPATPLRPSKAVVGRLVGLSEEEQHLIERMLQSQRRLIESNPIETSLLAVGRVLASICRYEGRPDAANAVLETAARADIEGLLRAIDGWTGDAPPAVVAASVHSPVPVPVATAEHPRAQTPGPAAKTSADDTAVRPLAAEGFARSELLAEAGTSESGASKVLKVSQEKIDRLMDLIGEMVVAKNSLPYLAARAETSSNPREIARDIKTQYGVINRIAEEMQDAIMQVRMLPVGSIFQRFPRLVRDISRKLGKQVELYMEGEDAEADKNIVESLADPLIHIVRNSLDHGLEPPEERRAAGKREIGLIRITAFQEADRVIIEIGDDGRGIDPARIKAKALDRGLIDEARAATMTDHEAVQLVFAAGLSTAEQISDLSGRGVGMDVVRSAIERAQGQVQLSSELGRGTRIRIALPLSMAVTNVMIIRSAEQMFGVQMDMVVETVRVPAEAIHQIKQQRTTVLRGRIVPLYALNDLLRIPAQPVANEAGEVAVLVIRLGDQDVGVIVDDFDATLDLILKPLEGVLGELGGYAGTALLGDGSVLMVLNLKELL